ncbi:MULTISPECIES: hypothetical protein [unclassified Pedobacter]|uniref:hypothetical protein n=1 Tax=unclassified Pedobacter TaxID=2628915 RepID=UPI001D5FA60E|nr:MULTISPECIES: hypothetical protein [unclassified Pedobacter]CAH0167404.1 hypothetical protein SRABI126_00941 [Pedobacter sp. Bi126]CAH0285810.1 hypothetical protein SRABI36_04153 [Pedobacter sp. Bi36]
MKAVKIDQKKISITHGINLTSSQHVNKPHNVMEASQVDEAIARLKAKGYTLTFNPEDSSAASWGVSGPWPSDIEFEIDEVITCEGPDKTRLKVLAITTKPFGLKGIRISSAEEQKYWTVEEVVAGFKKIVKSILFSLFKRH